MAAPSSWKAWRSVSVAWARIGTEVPAELEELLAGIGATIDAVGGSFTMRHTTVAVTAARTGAASPAFTLSAPGGDAETVRRHGDFVSADPRLAYGAGVQGFFVGHRGHHYASTALMDPMTKAFVADIHGFVAARGLELVSFGKERKDDVAGEFLARFTGAQGVLFVGRAQEKALVWRTQRRYNQAGEPYAWLVRSTAFINYFYFYCLDEDFGPFFIKFSTYFPYTAKLCINGNECAKRQAAKAGIGFEALDNGFAAVDDVAGVQAICDSLGPAQIDALLRKWLAILPNPFTDEDQAAGYRYELSILQAEFSLTQMLDAPVSGRIFFEQVIRDNLDIGRPDHVG